MKIKAPDDIETYTENEAEHDCKLKNVNKTFEDEIKEILKMSKISHKFIYEGLNTKSSDFSFQVLFKFTRMCQEEIIPRHIKAIETIESKSDDVQYKLACQQKELGLLKIHRQELYESTQRIEAAKALAVVKHHDLNERLKDVVKKLQDLCKNRTIAERQMAQDLVNFKKKAENLKVGITELASKVNYYTTQVKTQTDVVKRHTKPLYLDKNRVVFLRANLNNMRQNIQELVHRVKNLKEQTLQLTEPDFSDDLSKIKNSVQLPKEK